MTIYDKRYLNQKAIESGFNRDTYEKVLRLIEVLSFINSDLFLKERLALKGGTAINLLYFNVPRLSVDIDLDYTVSSDVDQMKHDREKINHRISDYMNQQGYTKNKVDRSSFILDSNYFTYVNNSGNLDRIKLDINYVMRAHIYPTEQMKITSTAFKNDNMITTLNCIEIYGSKINALNNRAAVRDLYDVRNMIKNNILDEQTDELRKAVIFYHVLTNDKINGIFDLSKANELKQNDILRELTPVLNKKEHFKLNDELNAVKSYIKKLMLLTENERLFIQKFSDGSYEPYLLFDNEQIIERLKTHPMAKWKCKHQ